MIIGCQIRAARALLNMSQDELAKAAGLTPQAIRKIENGDVRPREGTMNDITAVFTDRGVEFTENSGVGFISNDVEIFEGIDRFEVFTDYVINHMQKVGGEMCVSAVDETQFAKHRKDPEGYRVRMKKLVDGGNVRVRILANKSNFISSFAEVKQQTDHEGLTPTSFYAFGNCLALISFTHNPSPYVVLLKSGPFAEAYKAAFETRWAIAKEPPK